MVEAGPGNLQAAHSGIAPNLQFVRFFKMNWLPCIFKPHHASHYFSSTPFCKYEFQFGE